MITVVIPTHNPKTEFLYRTLAALRNQSLSLDEWQLLIIDNASPEAVNPACISWHPCARVVQEKNLGLTHARLRGIVEAEHELLVWSDDDNLLAPDYLAKAAEAFANSPKMGAAGGKSIPEYQEEPPDWYRSDLAPLGCRDLGDQPKLARWNPNHPEYPSGAPIGAGLVIRREALLPWAEAVRSDPRRLALGRKGSSLTSGEDNDINLCVLRQGWELAYLPQLSLIHLIPPGRLSFDYQQQISRTSFRDFIRVLDIHGIRPWSEISPATVHLRAAKAWFTFQAWKGPCERIRWQGAIGQFEGRAQLSPNP